MTVTSYWVLTMMKNNLNNFLPLINKAKLMENSTPFFIYDQKRIQSNIECIFAFLEKMQLKKKESRFYFSYKSCPQEAVVKEVMKHFYGVDVSSFKEYQEIKKLGISPQKISVSGPAKTTPFLQTLIEEDVSAIHFDSLDEIDEYVLLLKNSGKKTSTQFSCRLNADKNSSKLGMSVLDCKKALRENKILITGLHAYLGREQFSTALMDSLTKELTDLTALYPQIKDIFLGPGLKDECRNEKVNYQSRLTNVNWNFEMGRAVIDTAGYYFSPILSVKNREAEQADVIINGGIQHYLSAFTNIQKMAEHTSQILNEDGEVVEGNVEARVYGSLCLPNDLFGWIENCPDQVQRGWWTCFYPCGAYNINASLNDFIKQDSARVFLLDTEAGVIKQL